MFFFSSSPFRTRKILLFKSYHDKCYHLYLAVFFCYWKRQEDNTVLDSSWFYSTFHQFEGTCLELTNTLRFEKKNKMFWYGYIACSIDLFYWHWIHTRLIVVDRFRKIMFWFFINSINERKNPGTSGYRCNFHFLHFT